MKDHKTGAGRLVVRREILARLIGLPEGSEILGIDQAVHLDCFDLLVRGPGLPTVERGECAPMVAARLTRDESGATRFVGYEHPLSGESIK